MENHFRMNALLIIYEMVKLHAERTERATTVLVDEVHLRLLWTWKLEVLFFWTYCLVLAEIVYFLHNTENDISVNVFWLYRFFTASSFWEG